LVQRPRALSVFVFVVPKRSVLHHARSTCVHVSHLHSSLCLFPFRHVIQPSKKCLGLPPLISLLVVRVHVRLTEARILRGLHIRTIMVLTLTEVTGTRGTGKEHMRWNGTVPCMIMVAVVVAEVQRMVRRVSTTS
jgi:hypothetical protein